MRAEFSTNFNLQGRVKFPIGGKVREQNEKGLAGTGEIPVPTV